MCLGSGIRDSGSGILNKKLSGSRIQGSKRFWIPDPQHCQKIFTFLFSCKFFSIFGSVTDPGCLARIPDPDSYPFRISDPKTATKERGADPDP